MELNMVKAEISLPKIPYSYFESFKKFNHHDPNHNEIFV